MRSGFRHSRRGRALVGVLAFGIAYYWLSELGLSLVAEPSQVAVLWPASGLALGVFAKSPLRWWPALSATIFIANVVAQLLERGVSPTSIGLAGVNALEPVLAGAALLVVAGGGRPLAYGSLRSVAGLVAAATLANAVTATTAGLLLWGGLGAPLWAAASTWWFADGLGMLSVAPVVIALAERHRHRVRWTELALVAASVLAALFVAWPFPAGPPEYLDTAYVVLPFVVWTALRAGPRATGAATLAVTMILSVATILGTGPFVDAGQDSLAGVQALQSFLAVLAILPLLVGGVLAERREIEARLASSSERLGSVLRAATELSVIGTDEQGTITVFNEGAERMLGYRAEEVVGRATPALIHDADEVVARAHEMGIAPGFEVFVRAARAGRADTREWTYIRKDGRLLRVSLTVTARRDADGALVGFIGIARDITESARTEAERATMVRVARAVASADGDDGVFDEVVGEVANLVGASAAAIVRFEPEGTGTCIGGWSAHGDSPTGTTIWLDGGMATAKVSRTGRTERSDPYGAAADMPATNAGLTEGVATPILVDGAVWGALSVGADPRRSLPRDVESVLTRFAGLASLAAASVERRNALERSRDELSTIIDGIPALVWVTDRSGRLLLANRAHGRARDAGAAPPVSEAHDADEGAQAGDAEVTVVDEAGVERTYLVGRSALRDRAGGVYAHCHVGTDITHRHEIERAKDEFVSVVSHELRTPLTSIHGALDLMAEAGEELDPGSRRRMVGIASTNCARLVTLINDILDLQRITASPPELRSEVCDGADLLRGAAEGMSSFALDRGIEIEVAAAPSPVRVDRGRIQQVLDNLLSNAIKFSPERGKVTVGTVRRPSELRLFVRDTGRGIPPEKLEVIFERFAQLDSSDSRRHGGSGLGLAICRQIVELHGGRIWAESAPDSGSCFWVSLPVEAASSAPPPRPPSTTPPQVLVVEDDAQLAGLLAEQLRRGGFAVTSARTGADAVAMAAECEPDVVLLDVAVPGGDGFDVVESLRARGAEPALVVVYTGTELDGEQRERLRLGNSTIFLTKASSSPRDLREAITAALPDPG